MVLDLRWLNLQFFNFSMVQKQCAFNGTALWISLFSRLALCSLTISPGGWAVAVTQPWDPEDEQVIHLQLFCTPTIHDCQLLQSIHYMGYPISCYIWALHQPSWRLMKCSERVEGEAKLCLWISCIKWIFDFMIFSTSQYFQLNDGFIRT